MESILSYINVQQIVNFITVVEQRGFLAASEYLHMTQSSVSKSIGRLEETLGFPLFVKEHKGSRIFRDAQLTEQGKYLYQYWAPALREIENAYQHVVAEVRQSQKTLNIAYTNTSDPDKYFWPILNKMLEERDAAEVNVESNYRSELLGGLAEGKYDVVFVPDIEYYSINPVLMDYQYASIDNAQIIVPESNHLYDREILMIEDLKDELFFIFNDGRSETQNKTLLEFFKRVHINPPMKELHKDAFNINNAYLKANALTLIDANFDLGTHTRLRRIPLKGYYNGMLCVWRKNVHKKEYVRRFLSYFPDLEERKAGKKPVVQMDEK